MKDGKIDDQSSGETYQALRERLDETLLRLQDPEQDVDAAVDLYEQALTDIVKLENHLESAGNRINRIQTDFGIISPADRPDKDAGA